MNILGVVTSSAAWQPYVCGRRIRVFPVARRPGTAAAERTLDVSASTSTSCTRAHV
jgi:hypothetical protein